MSPRHRRRGSLALVSAGAALALGIAIANATPASSHAVQCRAARVCATARRHARGGRAGTSFRPSRRPNIVFVLTDDLSMDLLPYLPHVQAMQRDGLTFENYFVSDSLCCPSRASILTGNFPHDTGIVDNFGPHGGFPEFYRLREARHTSAIALQRAGYLTGMMGKYLNGYLNSPDGEHTPKIPSTYVAPGWSEWDVAGWGYPEYDYKLNENGKLKWFGHRPSDYLTNVLAGKGVDFINRAAHHGKPFFLELATFAPHEPYTPAPRDIRSYLGLVAPHPANFNRLPAHAPRWLADYPRLTPDQIASIDWVFRHRAEAVQAVDALIGTIEQTLVADGVARNTYVVFSSDNGLHTGAYRLMPGKMTAFDTDIHVPLVVDGPGVPAGATTGAMAENVDLAKTFAAIGGTSMTSDGHSLLPVFHGHTRAGWRNAILVEHHGGNMSPLDPDYQTAPSGDPPSYAAMRTSSFLYVEYADGEREFYNLRRDPFELDNLARLLSRATRTRLHRELSAMHQCHGGPACWAAMHTRGNVRLS